MLCFFFRVASHIIAEYFNEGHSYKVILQFLSVHHGVNISLRTLKRRLRDMALKRHMQSPLIDVWNAIVAELRGPGIRALTNPT